MLEGPAHFVEYCDSGFEQLGALLLMLLLRDPPAQAPAVSPTRAREALMMAGAGGAMRATGWRATAIRFQQFGEGGSYGIAR
jgi:hypothetical protein